MFSVGRCEWDHAKMLLPQISMYTALQGNQTKLYEWGNLPSIVKTLYTNIETKLIKLANHSPPKYELIIHGSSSSIP